MEAICPDSDTSTADERNARVRLDADDLLDLLTGLRDKFLVSRAEHVDPGVTRFRLLETIREYASSKLEEAGALGDMTRRHAGYYLDELGRLYPMLKEDRQPLVVATIGEDHENYLSAIDTFSIGAQSGSEEDTVRAWRMADGLGLFWWVRGHWGAAGRILASVLELPSREAASSDRVQVLLWRGHFLSNTGRTEEARQVLDAAVAEARVLGIRGLIGRALSYRGQLAYAQSHYEESIALMAEALEIHRERGDRRATAIALASLGNAEEMLGMIRQAIPRFEESLRTARESKDSQNVGYALQRLAHLAVIEGRLDDAERYALEAAPIVESMGNVWGQANTLMVLGDVALHRGDRDAARDRFRRTLPLYAQLGDEGSALRGEVRLGFLAAEAGDGSEALRWFRSALERCVAVTARRDLVGLAQGFGQVAIVLGRDDQAARLFGASEGLAGRQNVTMWVEERRNLDSARERLLGPGAKRSLRTAWDQGRALDEESVVALCREVGPAAGATPSSR